MSTAKSIGSSVDPILSRQDAGLAIGMVVILTILFLPLPAVLIDVGLALSIALAILILMVALWIRRPIEFSAFPAFVLVATFLRLALNVATTRLILLHGGEGPGAAGSVVEAFGRFVIEGDVLIGLVVFLILTIINFVVDHEGRGARRRGRCPLHPRRDARQADGGRRRPRRRRHRRRSRRVRRRRELERESGLLRRDGRRDEVRPRRRHRRPLIITPSTSSAASSSAWRATTCRSIAAVEVFTKLSVGDGLVTQMPALIVSLAAGLLVSKGGTHGSAEKVILGQIRQLSAAR